MKIDNLEDSLGNLEADCGLASGFCLDLLRQDEWSFIIKVHALLEAAVAKLLVHALGRKELIDVFGALGMGNTKTGKLAFVRALNLLPKQHTEFISALSVLRNQLAHGVKNVTIELKKHFAAERDKGTKQEARKLADKWGFGFKDGDKTPEPLARYHFMINMPNGTIASVVRRI